jgi:hypothetical protein
MDSCRKEISSVNFQNTIFFEFAYNNLLYGLKIKNYRFVPRTEEGGIKTPVKGIISYIFIQRIDLALTSAFLR